MVVMLLRERLPMARVSFHSSLLCCRTGVDMKWDRSSDVDTGDSTHCIRFVGRL